MLMTPYTTLPYKPTVDSFLAGLSTEYKDKNFKDKLLQLNPNSKVDRECIIRNYILEGQGYLSYRHKFLLIKELEKALLNELYDFSAPFEYDYDANEPSASPWPASEIQTPRSFFEDIFIIACNTWERDISMAAAEDSSAW